jgi:hypothetical protein
MKKISIKKKELLKIINQLEKSSDYFDGFGTAWYHLVLDEEEQLFSQAEVLLDSSIINLKKLAGILGDTN